MAHSRELTSAEFAAHPDFLSGGGELGQAVRSFDWGATPLGEPDQWPSALKTALTLMLGARQPVYVAWGSELTSFYNDAYLPIVGDKHPRGLGQPFCELWAEIWESFRPIVEATMAGDAQYFVDLPISLAGRPGVSEGYFTFSYTPLRNEAGTIAGFYCAATETTDRVLAERRRAAEADRQRLMFENAPGFIASLEGPDHLVTFVNAAHRQLFGSADWVGKSIRAAFPVGVGQGFFELLDDVFATGRRHVANAAPATFSVTEDRPAEQRLLDFVYEPMIGDDDDVFGIFVQGSDVTDRHAAEQALTARQAELESLYGSAPIGLAFFDREYRYLRVNDELAEVNGVPIAAHIGRTLREIVPVSAAVVEPVIDDIFATGRAVRDLEISGETARQPGVLRHWLTGFYPVRGADQAVEAVGAWVIEISERKAAEERERLLAREVDGSADQGNRRGWTQGEHFGPNPGARACPRPARRSALGRGPIEQSRGRGTGPV